MSIFLSGSDTLSHCILSCTARHLLLNFLHFHMFLKLFELCHTMSGCVKPTLVNLLKLVWPLAFLQGNHLLSVLFHRLFRLTFILPFMNKLIFCVLEMDERQHL